MVKPRTLEPLLPDGSFNLTEVIHRLSEAREPKDIQLIEKALELAQAKGESQLTPFKVSCLTQGLNMALLLDDLGLDAPSIAAAIVVPSYAHANLTLEQIQKILGLETANLVTNIEKLHCVHVDPNLQQTENLRRLLLAVVEDVRGVLIRLAEHTCTLRIAVKSNVENRKRFADETLELYAPLANRLGIGQIKWELEDLAFRILEPGAYKHIAKLLDERRIDREKYIEWVVSEIKETLKSEHIEGSVFGRAKHIYSIWKKMHRKGVSYHEIYDVHAVRVIVPTVRECYAALGVIHGLWQHVPKEFDDYIANPKENGYRSLHTAVIGAFGKTIEVQIRTEEMHKQAELGVAAHWRYKEGSKEPDALYEAKLAHLRQVLTWQEEWDKEGNLSDALKREVFQDRVYVLTPKGKVIDLPVDATVLDFAYTIHTDIGHRCRGAKVNGRMVPLIHHLKSGDQVEIITTKSGGPSRDWLNAELGYLNTVRARAKVHQWFRRLDREQNLTEGREVLDRELKRLSIDNLSFDALAHQLKIAKSEDMLVSLGSGDLRINQILTAIQALIKPLAEKQKDEQAALIRPQRPSLVKPGAAEVMVEGVGNLMSHMARCCKPIPGDEIIGYITLGRGVSVHRKDCVNILQANAKAKARLVAVEWGEKITRQYLAEINIQAYDRPLLLRDISSIIGVEHANVIDIKMHRSPSDNIVEFDLSIEISSIEILGKILLRIQQLPNIIEVKRIKN